VRSTYTKQPWLWRRKELFADGSKVTPQMGLLTMASLVFMARALLFLDHSLRVISSASNTMKELSAWVTTRDAELLGWNVSDVTGDARDGKRQCNRNLKYHVRQECYQTSKATRVVTRIHVSVSALGLTCQCRTHIPSLEHQPLLNTRHPD
jgi:hypothetical protein